LAAIPALAQSAPTVNVYVPRQVQVEGESLTLGQLCVIHSEDAALAKQAQAVAMGRGAMSREALVLDRQALLARLAAEGIPASRITFSGADKVTVTREEWLASPAELLAAAEAFLAKNAPGGAVKWSALKPPSALAGKASGPPTLSVKLLGGAAAGQAKVEVSMMDGVKTVARTEITYRLQYTVRQAVATREIAAGDTITPENAEVRSAVADRPAEDALPFGRVAAVAIPAGAVVIPGKLKAVKPAAAVAKDQTVVMRITGPAFTVTAMGQAMEAGEVGQCIRVRNIDSKRVVMATVRPDGSVEPVMQSSATSTDKTKAQAQTKPGPAAQPAPADDDTEPIAVLGTVNQGVQR